MMIDREAVRLNKEHAEKRGAADNHSHVAGERRLPPREISALRFERARLARRDDALVTAG